MVDLIRRIRISLQVVYMRLTELIGCDRGHSEAP